MLGALYGNSMSESDGGNALRSPIFVMLALGSTFVLSACYFGSSKTPTGQVVATVGGREITRRELQAELTGSAAPTPAAQKAQQQAALQHIIQRVILAKAAKDQGADKDPNFALLSQRANDELLIQLLENKIAASVPLPSSEEVEQFKQANPNMFAERQLFDVDQIRAPRPTDAKIVKQMEPLKTLDEIASFLTLNHIPFQRGTNVMDAVGQDPKLLNAIMALPAQEVFIVSSGNEIFINEIRETRVSPFLGEAATKFAINTLKAQHVREAVAREMNALLRKAQSTVQINKEYVPAKSPAPKPLPR